MALPSSKILFSRLPFLLLAFLSLLLGLWSGLKRMGWDLGMLSVSLHHGAIMVGGFLGTLISLEKIIPLKKKIFFIIPLLSASSVGLFFLGRPRPSFGLLVLAAAGLSAVFVYYLVREKNLIYLLMAAGSLCWLTGNLLLITENFYPLAFPWWLGFALLIITAERLELMKFLPVTRSVKLLLVLLLALYIGGVMISFHGSGHQVSGAALIAIALWLMRNDIIMIAIRKQGLPKFVAIALLSGYIAMLLTGIFFIALHGQALAYDAIVHTFFLGFVFSMIFAHGPIILPGVLGISLKPYHRMLYGWLTLLHISWITRVSGDILVELSWRNLSGIITTVAVLGYFATIATITVTSQRRHAKVL